VKKQQKKKTQKNNEQILTAVDFITVVRTILNGVTDLRRKYTLSSRPADPSWTSHVWTSCNRTHNLWWSNAVTIIPTTKLNWINACYKFTVYVYCKLLT